MNANFCTGPICFYIIKMFLAKNIYFLWFLGRFSTIFRYGKLLILIKRTVFNPKIFIFQSRKSTLKLKMLINQKQIKNLRRTGLRHRAALLLKTGSFVAVIKHQKIDIGLLRSMEWKPFVLCVALSLPHILAFAKSFIIAKKFQQMKKRTVMMK